MVRVRLRLVDRDSWAKYYDPSQPTALFCPTPDPPQVGQRVLVEVLFQDGPRVALRGTVMWRRPFGDDRARPGVGIEVEPTDESKLIYLDAYVRGGMLDKRRRRRLPIRLRVAYTAQSGRRVNFTRDLHEDGVFIWCSEFLEPGEETRLRILPPDAQGKPIEVRGVVAYKLQGEPNRGMGIKLSFPDASSRQAYLDFVAQLEKQLMAGKLPDETLG